MFVCLYVGLNIRLKSMYGQGLAYEGVLESVKNKLVIFFVIHKKSSFFINRVLLYIIEVSLLILYQVFTGI